MARYIVREEQQVRIFGSFSRSSGVFKSYIMWCKKILLLLIYHKQDKYKLSTYTIRYVHHRYGVHTKFKYL